MVRAVTEYLEEYYGRVIASVDALDLDALVRRKNPYMYYANNIGSAQEFVDTVLSAFVTSSQETFFGNVFFERLVIAVSGGTKTLAEGSDIEVRTDTDLFVISVKSSKDVFNSDSKKKQIDHFRKLQKVAAQTGLNYRPMIGYAYTKCWKKNEDFYKEFVGQDFWEILTGDKEFYLKIVDFMGDMPDRFGD